MPGWTYRGLGAFVDCSGALAALRVLLDPLRALVSPATMSNLLGLLGRRVGQCPPRFELVLGFGGDKLAFLLPPGIPEPFATFPEPAPTNVGAKIPSFELMAAMVLFALVLAGSRMLRGKNVMSRITFLLAKIRREKRVRYSFYCTLPENFSSFQVMNPYVFQYNFSS